MDGEKVGQSETMDCKEVLVLAILARPMEAGSLGGKVFHVCRTQESDVRGGRARYGQLLVQLELKLESKQGKT